MRRIMIILILTFIYIAGCGIQERDYAHRGNPPSVTEAEYNGQFPTDEDLIIGAKNQITIDVENQNPEKRYYSKEEAKQLVKKHLKHQNRDGTSVSFEGFDGEQYLFHAFEMVHFNNQPERLTRGWYKVNPHSGQVTIADQ